VFSKIISVFKRHGAETIDTPIFELKVVVKWMMFWGLTNLMIYNYSEFS
jgi:histidyl-tRNA synthetase